MAFASPFRAPTVILCATLLIAFICRSLAADIFTTSVVQIELNDFAFKVYALKPGTTERLDKFSIELKLDELIEFVDFKFFNPDRRISFNTTTSTKSRRQIIESGVLVDRFEQTAYFSNGINFTLRVETFNATVIRNYFGWKLTLSPNNVKMSYFINGTDRTTLSNFTRYPGSSYQLGIYAKYSVELMLNANISPEDLLTLGSLNCSALRFSGLPVYSCSNIAFPPDQRFDPAVVPQGAQYTRLDINDARLNVSIVQQEDTLLTNRSGNFFENLETFRFVVPGTNDDFAAVLSILQQAARIAALPNRYGFLNVTTAIAFRPDLSGASSYDYDPDLSIIFNTISDTVSPSGAPVAATEEAIVSATAAIVGGVVAAVVVVLIVISVPVALKVVFPYMARRKETHQEELPGPAEPVATPHRSSTWTRASKPE